MAAPSAGDAATTAVERLRAVRERAKQRRDASRKAVEQLRTRNREESKQLTERARLARRGQAPPPPWPDHGQPRELHLYNVDEAEAPAQPPGQPQPPRPQRPQRTTDDDWSQESWLH